MVWFCHDVVSPLCDVVSLLRDVVSSLCDPVLSLCHFFDACCGFVIGSCALCLFTITSSAKPWYPVFIPPLQITSGESSCVSYIEG